MTEKLKVKFLTVIWGSRYIEEFASISLPSYLAPGNLPFVASETDLEIVIMTSTDSRNKFEEQPIFDRLKGLCTVRYIFIDDLITTGNYGVILTLAYARGILDSGTNQTNTNFVFMNSDFVLAEGSLRTLIAKLHEGHRCIMAPSLRACSETAIPKLVATINRTDQTLIMSSREMVQLAFDNLHPTVIAKTITQDFVTCATHNQIYWQVDEATLLGRYHLIFMLAIKPEVPMGPVNSYCDYGFVPELVPSKQFCIIDDSDGFFMLELQPSAQEKNFLRCGITTPAKIAAELSAWTTSEQQRFAEVDVVFRSGGRPAALAGVRAEAAQFIKNLHERMTSPPVNHVDHFYWTSGVQAWSSLKFPGEPPVFPPELGILPSIAAGESAPAKSQKAVRPSSQSKPRFSLVGSYIGLLGVARRMIGVVPNVPIWNHLWLDSRLVLYWIKTTHSKQQNLLFCEEGSSLPASLRKLLQFDLLIGFDGLLLTTAVGQQNEAAQGRYDNVLVHVGRDKLFKLRELLKIAEGYAKPDATIATFIEFKQSENDESNFSLELARCAEEILPANWMRYRLNASFAGGRIKRRLRRIEKSLLRYLWPSSLGRLPHLIVAATLWPIVATLIAAYNFSMRNLSSECPDYCSSALLFFSKLPIHGKVDTNMRDIGALPPRVN